MVAGDPPDLAWRRKALWREPSEWQGDRGAEIGGAGRSSAPLRNGRWPMSKRLRVNCEATPLAILSVPRCCRRRSV